MLNLFGFGKKRRSSRKTMKNRKPPARLLKCCKKYGVKTTKKVGSKRVYKKVGVLKKACLKKARALLKKVQKKSRFGKTNRSVSKFGKRSRRRVPRSKSKKAAMKAFKSFYSKHCAGRRSRFGNGGNPSLYNSMGYEFCPDGQGGVLGANSTGLFPSPCVTQATTVFGRRRRRRSAVGSKSRASKNSIGRRRRRRSAIGSVKRRSRRRCY